MDDHANQELLGQAREARRVTWLGLIGNLLLAGFKMAGGLLGGSQAVVADAVHSLSDSSTDVAVLIGVSYWSKPPDRTHPHGHGRIETLVTGGIGLMLAAVAVGLAYNAVVTLQERHASPPGGIALGAAFISIVSKELLYRWTVKVGRRIRSSAVVANAWHHRSDALSSIPVLLAVAGARLHPEWAILDHIGAIVVSVFIFRAAAMIAWPALKELIDTGAPPEVLQRIAGIALGVDGVARVHAIRTRRVGGRFHVDLHILVDGDISVRRGHDIAEEVQRRLIREERDLADVVVHVEPREDGDEPGPLEDSR